jgi:hypothetical protein
VAPLLSAAHHAAREAAEHCSAAAGFAAVAAQRGSRGQADHSAPAEDCSVVAAAHLDSPGPAGNRRRSAAEVNYSVAVGPDSVARRSSRRVPAGHSAPGEDCSAAVAAHPDSPGPPGHSVQAANCSAAVGPGSAARPAVN